MLFLLHEPSVSICFDSNWKAYCYYADVYDRGKEAGGHRPVVTAVYSYQNTHWNFSSSLLDYVYEHSIIQIHPTEVSSRILKKQVMT